MDVFIVIAILVITSAFYSYINARFIKLPGTIGVISIAIVVAVATLILDSTNAAVARYLTSFAKGINFSTAVLNIMLGFLLFAGSFNLDVQRLKKEMRPVIVLSTLSVILSTGLFGMLFYWATMLFHLNIPLIYCLLFGALIAPTDPVAVSAILKKSKLPIHLDTIITGESLFNDGVSLVIFITILELIQSDSKYLDLSKAAVLFVREVIGGVALGLVAGYLANRLMRSITDFQTIVMISIALVMLVSLLASVWHISIPLSVVSAGIFTGYRTINTGTNERSHQLLESFWKLTDELLNTILFVMVGMQMAVVPNLNNYWLTGGAAILITLVARWFSISLPLTFLRRSLNIPYSNVAVLTWAGVRGAISIALALSLPQSDYRNLILSSSYFVVIFSIIFQGLSLNKLINRVYSNLDKGD